MSARTVKLFSCILAITLFTSTTQASEPPELPFENRIPWPPRAPTPPATSLMLGKFRVAFSETTLPHVLQTLRVGHIGIREGAMNGNMRWLCYTLPRARLWIISDQDQGWPNHRITQVLITQSASEPDPDCPTLPAKFLPAKFSSGLWLNSSLKELTARLGQATYEDGQWRIDIFDGQIPKKVGSGGFNLLNWMFCKKADGRCAEVRVGFMKSLMSSTPD